MWSSFSCGQRNPSKNNFNHYFVNRTAQWQSKNSKIDNEWPIYATINRSGMDLLVPGSESALQLNESTCSSSGYGSQDSRYVKLRRKLMHLLKKILRNV